MERDTVRVLAVEDNPADFRLLKEYLRDYPNFEIVHTGTLQGAMKLLAADRFAVVLLDLNLPDSSCFEGLEKILETTPAPPVIVLTEIADEETGLLALSKNAQDYLVKGKIDSNTIVRSIRYAIARDKAEEAIRQLNAQLEQRVAEQTSEIRAANEMLEQRVAMRTAELHVANENLNASRIAALNLMEDALELRRHAELVSAELRSSEERLKRAQEIARLGSWELDLTTNSLSWSDEAYRIFGLQPQEFAATYEAFLDMVHPDDRAAVDAAYSRSVHEGQNAYEIEHRVVRKSDGGIRTVHEKCEHVRDASGQIIRSVGMVHDITERKEAEKRLRLLSTALESAANSIVITNQRGQIQWANPAFTKLTGYSTEEILGRNPRLLSSGRHTREFYRGMWEKILGGEPWAGEVVNRHKDGTLYTDEMTITPVRTGGKEITHFVAIKENVTERKQKEEELHRLNRTLKALSNSSQAMMRAVDETQYLQEVCKIVVEDCGHAMVWIGFAEEDEGKSVRPVASAGFEEGYLETLQITWADTERGRGPTGTAIRTGRPSACPNMLTDPKFEPWRQEALKRGYASSLVIPLMAGEKAFGALSIYSRELSSFTDDEVQLLVELADDLAYSIKAIRLRVAHELSEENLRQSETRLLLAQRAGHVGVFDLDLTTGKGVWSDELKNIYGVPPESEGSVEAWKNLLHPVDLPKVQDQIKRATRAHLSEIELEYRIIRPDKEIRWLEDRGIISYNEADHRKQMIGTTIDITTRKRAEETFRQDERRFRKSAVQVLGSVAISLVAAETIVMILLSHLHPLPVGLDIVLDGISMLLLVSPVLYFRLFRPMLLFIREHDQAEAALRHAYDDLELRVKERTTSLAVANERLEREIVERTRAQAETIHTMKNLEFISESATTLLREQSKEDVFRYIAGKISHALGGELVVINEYDPLNTCTIVQAVEGNPDDIRMLSGILGRDLVGWNVQFDPAARSGMKGGSLTRVKGGLYDLTSGKLPQPLCHDMEKALGLGDIFAMPFTLEEDLLGTVVLLTRAQGFPANELVVETIVNQAAVVLKRMRVLEERKRLLIEAQRERERAESLARELKAEKNIIDAIMENTKTQLAYLDPDFNFVLVNSACAHGSGYPKDKLIGKNYFALFPDEANLSTFEKVRDTERPIEFFARPLEFAEQPWRGVTYWDWNLVPVKGVDGLVQGLAFSLVDVTEHKRTEAALRTALEQLNAEQSKLKAIFENAPEGIVVTDEAGRIVMANLVAEELYMQPVSHADEEQPTRLLNLRYPGTIESEPPDLPMTRSAVRGETLREVEMQLALPGGELRDLLVNSAPIANETGSIAGAVGIFHDITLRKQAEETLRKSAEEYELLMEEAGSGMLLVDGRGTIIAANKRFAEIVGMEKAECLSRGLDEILFADDVKRFFHVIESVNRGEKVAIEHALKRKDNTLVYVETDAKLLPNGPIRVIVHDLTEQKAKEERFKHMIREEVFEKLFLKLRAFRHGQSGAMNLNRLALYAENLQVPEGGSLGVGEEKVRNFMERFASVMDEFRTIVAPELTHIASLVMLVETGGSPSAMEEYKHSAEELLTLVEHMTEKLNVLGVLSEEFASPILETMLPVLQEVISTVTRMQMTIRNVSNAVDTNFVSDIIPVMRSAISKFESQQSEITIDIDPSTVNCRTIISPSELGEVLVVLVQNALEACDSVRKEEGERTRVDISATDVGETVRITVQDNGPGVSEGIRNRLFQTGVTQKGAGRGFGLSYAAKCVGKYSGKLSLDTSCKAGARFVVELLKR